MGLLGFAAKEAVRAFGKRPTIPTMPGTKLHEVAKEYAKHGPDGISRMDLGGYGKSIVDPHLSEAVRPQFVMNVDEAVRELPKDVSLRYDYLTQLLRKLHQKDDVRAVIKYVKSAAAGNLSPDDRAHLLMTCLDKLRYIDVIGQFFH